MMAAQVQLEGLMGKPSVADSNGRQYTAHSALPAALRNKHWCFGEVPQPDLQLRNCQQHGQLRWLLSRTLN
jgi:hypothetical protein